MAHHIHLSHIRAGLPERARRLARGWFARAAGRRSLAALRELDDHLLCDVGLTRADVRRMARKG